MWLFSTKYVDTTLTSLCLRSALFVCFVVVIFVEIFSQIKLLLVTLLYATLVNVYVDLVVFTRTP